MLSKNQAKFIVSLRLKKQRQKYASFIAEGDKLVNETLASDLLIERIFALPNWIAKNPYQKAENHPQAIEINADEMKKISSLKTPSSVLAVVKTRNAPLELKLEANKRYLVLDEVQDPGNLGTIIRTADWFGFDEIFCSKNCADCYNSKVVQSTMGSIVRVKVRYHDLNEVFDKNTNIPIYGATLDGSSIKETTFPESCFVVIGNEGRGINQGILERLEKGFFIEGKGKAESLNAAVATAITLYTITE